MGFFGIEKKEIMQEAVDTIIGAKAKFKGELISSGAVSVNGEFEGKLSAEGDVIIARGSKVVGEVQGGSVVVSGRIDGNIFASQSLEITKNGRVHGDLVGGKIIIEEGSSYCGKVKVEAEQTEEKEQAQAEEEEVIEVVEEKSESVAEEETTQPQMF